MREEWNSVVVRAPNSRLLFDPRPAFVFTSREVRDNLFSRNRHRSARRLGHC
jgi:hypothetical protein